METIFAKILRREIPAEIVFEDEHTLAFKDIAPQAPVHVVVIPKAYVENVLALTESEIDLAGHVLFACGEVARILGLAKSGMRVVLNSGTDGGQTVPHLHAHVLGGRPLAWPPG